jgi:hypothetical protein
LSCCSGVVVGNVSAESTRASNRHHFLDRYLCFVSFSLEGGATVSSHPVCYVGYVEAAQAGPTEFVTSVNSVEKLLLI